MTLTDDAVHGLLTSRPKLANRVEPDEMSPKALSEQIPWKSPENLARSGRHTLPNARVSGNDRCVSRPIFSPASYQKAIYKPIILIEARFYWKSHHVAPRSFTGALLYAYTSYWCCRGARMAARIAVIYIRFLARPTRIGKRFKQQQSLQALTCTFLSSVLAQVALPSPSASANKLSRLRSSTATPTTTAGSKASPSLFTRAYIGVPVQEPS